MKPVHRDDIPLDVMKEIEQHFAEAMPGMKVVCVGDLPSDSPIVGEAIAAQADAQQKMEVVMCQGRCMDCGDQMPNWAKLETDEDWQPAAGWKHFKSLSDGEIIGWQCPKCDQQEQGVPSISPAQEPENK